MLLSKFEILQELGKGSYGAVLKVRRKEDQQFYAVKRVFISNLSAREVDNSVNEIRLLASINSPFIVSYRQAFYDQKEQSLNIVMEYADQGDLQRLISQKKAKKRTFSEAEVWTAASQVLTGLGELHSHKIIHRDIKSANIFLKGGVYKIGDFNVSKVLKEQLAHTQTGTPYYASPQIWKQLPYNEKSDIWSMGCILYEMCALRPPFMATSMEQLASKVVKGKYQRIPAMYSDQLQAFIGTMLKVRTAERADLATLLQHPQLINFEAPKKQSYLLHTIKVPKNLKKLTESLPMSNYDLQRFDSEPTLPPISRRKRKEQSMGIVRSGDSHLGSDRKIEEVKKQVPSSAKVLQESIRKRSIREARLHPQGSQARPALEELKRGLKYRDYRRQKPEFQANLARLDNEIEALLRKEREHIRKVIDYSKLKKNSVKQSLMGRAGSDVVLSRKVPDQSPSLQRLEPLTPVVIKGVENRPDRGRYQGEAGSEKRRPSIECKLPQWWG